MLLLCEYPNFVLLLQNALNKWGHNEVVSKYKESYNLRKNKFNFKQLQDELFKHHGFLSVKPLSVLFGILSMYDPA